MEDIETAEKLLGGGVNMQIDDGISFGEDMPLWIINNFFLLLI